MLNLTVETRLSPERAMKEIVDYYVGKHGLRMIEARGHLHGTNGAVDVAAIGTTIGKDDDSSWKKVLDGTVEYLEKTYGLDPEYYLLHFHAGEEAAIGHLTAQIRTGKPTSVDFESRELDEITRPFAAKL